MGKASKWFRSLLGLNKKSPNEPSSARKPPKKKWSFIKTNKENDHHYIYSNDPNKQAIAVAAATAAAAEVAVAAAQAAAEVVRLTSSGRATTPLSREVCDFEKEDVRSTWHGNEMLASYRSREEWAAVKIQSYFRSYLARRALRALKALVKIQALVRGHIVRKRTTDNVRRVQTLLRVQARALARRSLNFVSPNIDNKYIHEGHTTPENFEHVRAYSVEYNRSITLKKNGSRSEDKNFRLQGRANVHRPAEDERSDKILEIDPGIHRTPPKHRNPFHSSHLSLCSDQYSQSFTTSKDSTAHQPILSPSIYDVQSLSHFKLMQDLEDNCYFTAESSPQFYSATSKDASSRRGPFTPTKSDSSRSYHSGFSDHRNYMTLTESSRAKMRSLSAPRQRPPQYERTSSARRYPTPTYHSESRLNPQTGSGLHGDISNKVYPGSGYLDKFGMPTM